MGTTPRGIIYPNPTDPIANVDLQLKTLAETVDTAMGNAGGVGPAVALAPPLVAGTGWTLGYATGYKLGSVLAWIEVLATRTGAALTASTNGNLTNQTVATGLPTAFRPTARKAYWRSVDTGGVPWACQCDYASAGVIILAAGTPNAVLNTNAILTISGVYPLV